MIRLSSFRVCRFENVGKACRVWIMFLCDRAQDSRSQKHNEKRHARRSKHAAHPISLRDLARSPDQPSGKQRLKSRLGENTGRCPHEINASATDHKRECSKRNEYDRVVSEIKASTARAAAARIPKSGRRSRRFRTDEWAPFVRSTPATKVPAASSEGGVDSLMHCARSALNSVAGDIAYIYFDIRI